MAKNKFRITEKDFLLANRKASREEEIAKYGKQIIFRTSTQKSKKVYDRKRLKKAGIKTTDDLPFKILPPSRNFFHEQLPSTAANRSHQVNTLQR